MWRARTNRSRRLRSRGNAWVRGPFLRHAGRALGSRAASPLWRRVAAVLFVLALLAVAPALALAQSDSVVVRWTAPGDDGNVGTAATYDLRVSLSPITGGNFAQALSVPGMPAPRVSGSSQAVTVFGLTRGNTYYFAIKTADDKGNWSGLSNVVVFDWTLDTAPPAAPHGFSVLSEGDGVHLEWSANSEADLAGYNVYRSVGGGAGVRLNNALLTETEFVDTDPPPSLQGVAYQVTAVDARGNESARTLSTKIDLVTAKWALEAGYPNPSHASETVRIPVVVPAGAAGTVTLQILDSGGRLVRRLTLSDPPPGTATVTWDGLNDAGRATAPGVYRGWLVAGDTRSVVRLLRIP